MTVLIRMITLDHIDNREEIYINEDTGDRLIMNNLNSMIRRSHQYIKKIAGNNDRVG